MRRLIPLLALAAAAISRYLAAVSWAERGLPSGCGAGSGCGEVLKSRWSSLFGVPVGALAFLAYLALAGLAWRGLRDGPPEPLVRKALVAIAVAIICGALWFVALQLFVLMAICPWCMADHALGIAAGGLALWTALSRSGSATGLATTPARTAGAPADGFDTTLTTAPDGGDVFASPESAVGAARPQAPLAREFRTPAAVGVAAVLVLIGLQLAFPHRSPLARLPQDANADTGPGQARAIAVLQGRLQLLPHETPHIGSADADRLIVVMFDYCCPHCREAHEALRELAAEAGPNAPGVLLLPTPLDAKCNPAIEETEPRFAESCELARLALAVWRADRARFDEFDVWLFEPELPRKAAEARREAARLVGEAALEAALVDPWIEERIAADVGAYRDSGVRVLPVLLSPGASAVVGRTEDRRELRDVLRRDFGIGRGD
ncbi:MAG: hypothetical protein KF774_16650 [Planctomyces sp.]|nr:hypothetical protein [Planctomyces sp.]